MAGSRTGLCKIRIARIGLVSLLAMMWICSNLNAETGIPNAPLYNLIKPHASYAKFVVGEGEKACTVFEPREPKLNSAPVVIFLHGFMAISPDKYIGWIEHLVQNGYIVYYPTYQRVLPQGINEYSVNALAGIRSAFELSEQAGETYTYPRKNFVFAMGHSLGGMLAMWLCKVAESENIPVPRACFAVQPGGFEPQTNKSFPEDLVLVTLFGDRDRAVGSSYAVRAFEEMAKRDAKRTALVRMRSCFHGSEPVVADHFAPLAYKNRPFYLPESCGVNIQDVGYLWKMADNVFQEAIKKVPDMQQALVLWPATYLDNFPLAPWHIKFGDGTIWPQKPLMTKQRQRAGFEECAHLCATIYPEQAGAYHSVVFVSYNSAVSNLARAISARGFICEFLHLKQGTEIPALQYPDSLISDHDDIYGELNEPRPADWILVLDGNTANLAHMFFPPEYKPKGVIILADSVALDEPFDKSVNVLVLGRRNDPGMARKLFERLRQEEYSVNLHLAYGDGGLFSGFDKASDDAAATAFFFITRRLGIAYNDLPDPGFGFDTP